MNFTEALKEFKKGKKLTRDGHVMWLQKGIADLSTIEGPVNGLERDAFIDTKGATTIVMPTFRIIPAGYGMDHGWHPNEYDVIAEDWQLA